MTIDPRQVAEQGLLAAYAQRQSFPDIVRDLMRAGFESYLVEFRLGTATYFTPEGAAHVVPLPAQHGPVAPGFAPDLVARAVRDAQIGADGYTFAGFCDRLCAAGGAGYLVSFSGRRDLYFGRTGETHVEHFPS